MESNPEPTFPARRRNLDGTARWYVLDLNPSFNEPMCRHSDASTYRCLHGQLHCEDGPAIEYANGTRYWFIHGQLHREDGPATVMFDGERNWSRHGLLHREDGPAVEKADGTIQWWWRGVEVPQHVVEQPETITVDEIESQANAEVRRVMIERFGLNRYMAEARFEAMAQDDFGTLLRKTQFNDEDLTVVKVVCPSTGHVHFLRVPPTTTTPLEGVAWTFDMTPREYLLSAEA